MKSFFVLTAVLTIQNLLGADFVRFTENLSDRRICTVRDGERLCDAVAFNSGGFTARITIPGLSGPFESSTVFSLVLGNYQFEGRLGDADVFSSNHVAFFFTFYDNNDHPIRYGAIGLLLSSNVLSIAGRGKPIDSSIVADRGTWDDKGKGAIPFSVVIGGLQFQRTVYFVAAATQRPSSEPGGDPLRNIIVAGKADYVRPTVAVTSPRNRARVTDAEVVFRGTARDNVTVEQVLYRVGAGGWTPTTGTTNWTAAIAMPVGTNVVEIKSVDQEAQESRITSRTVIRSP